MGSVAIDTFYRAFRRLTIGKALVGREPFHQVDRSLPLEHHGSPYGGWSILANSLSSNAIVYSFGIGHDASFDLSLAEKYGCIIHAYDPTPSSLEWVKSTIQEPRFVMKAVAIADSDRILHFHTPSPSTADRVSASCHVDLGSGIGFQAPGRCLHSLMRENAHSFCHLVKLDVEGMEYPVVSSWIDSGEVSCIDQLLIEFHHFLPGISVSDTNQLVGRLRNAGFAIGWISRTNHEYLFLRRSTIKR